MTDLLLTDPAALEDVGAASWEQLQGDLLRGFVHSLNNRVASLTAFTDLATMDSSPLDVASVRNEINRMYELTSLIGRLAARSDEPEALEVCPLLDSAIKMHDHHARSTRRTTEIRQAQTVYPVRVPRYALLRLLLLIVDGCRRKPLKTLAIEVGGDAEIVALGFHECDEITDEMQDLARVCGATLRNENGNVNLTLPSLMALRRLPDRH